MSREKKYVLLICGAPYTCEGADTALLFAKALLKKGHSIEQVFFYHDGVYTGTHLAAPEQAERNISKNWSKWASTQSIELVLCSHSAMKRGILDQQTAQQLEFDQYNLNPAFKLQGLGQFVDAVIRADRLVSFGQSHG